MRRGWAAAIALLALLAAGPAAAAVAAPMTDPVDLGSGYVVDEASVLSGAEETRAQQRLEQFRAQSGLDLWVVFVEDFTNPASSEQWANQVAESNGLGPTQYLLAVAVEGRQYYLSGDSAGPVTGDQLGTIEQQLIQPQLQTENWLGAVEAAANGLADAAGGGTGAGTGGDAGGGAVSVILIVVVVLAVIGIVIWLVVRSRRKARVGAGAHAPAEQLSTKDLERQAGSALVETDDAIRTSEEELGFARAQFGDAATTEFAAALEAARESLSQAFHLKQKLDDATPDTEDEIRSWNAQIVQLCRDASATLDEKAADFDELRKLEKNAPEALARVQELRAATEPRIVQAEASLAALAARYAPTALTTISDNPAQARQRLAFADEQLAAAEQAIGVGEGGEAAVGIRAAEEAVDQAALLSDAVGKLGDDLAKAEGSIGQLVANLQQDVAAASALPDPDGRLAPVIAATRQAISSATAAMESPQLAPLRVLESLESADAQIDTLIAGVRDQQQAAQRAQQQLGQLMMQAQAQVSAAEDYITARRGAVGADARTRLAEAGASLVQAQQLQASDPRHALASAQRANQLAGDAIRLAQNDVGAFQGGAGMLGGSGGGNVLGAVLGGIVINSMLGGGGGRRSSRGGGMFGGGFGGGRSPGSFGGGGTRGRRGGGRF